MISWPLKRGVITEFSGESLNVNHGLMARQLANCPKSRHYGYLPERSSTFKSSMGSGCLPPGFQTSVEPAIDSGSIVADSERMLHARKGPASFNPGQFCDPTARRCQLHLNRRREDVSALMEPRTYRELQNILRGNLCSAAR